MFLCSFATVTLSLAVIDSSELLNPAQTAELKPGES